jgi:hypothetical protein
MTPYVLHILFTIHSTPIHFTSPHLFGPLSSVGAEGLQNVFPIYNNIQNTTEKRPATVFKIRSKFGKTVALPCFALQQLIILQ